jgi:hypothetical protein
MRRGAPFAVLALLLAGACTRSTATEHRATQPAEPVVPEVQQPSPPDRVDPPAIQPSVEPTSEASPAASSTTPDAAALTGTWAGTYFYTMGSGGGPTTGSVAFFAELTVDAGKIHGSIVEPNTIGDRTASELRATVEGSIAEDGLVRFVKQYDGSGGVAHAIEYVGRLDPLTQQIEGVWKVSGSEGRFVMRRHNRLPELAHR